MSKLSTEMLHNRAYKENTSKLVAPGRIQVSSAMVHLLRRGTLGCKRALVLAWQSGL